MRSPRPTLRLALLLLFASLFAVIPASTSAQNGANANACKHGGWQSLRDSASTPFPNQGQCVSFAVQGGAFSQDPVTPTTAPSLAIVGGVTTNDGTFSGTGFTPGASVASLEWESEPYGLGDTSYTRIADLSGYVTQPIDANGAFTSIATFSWCNAAAEGWDKYGITLWTLTVTDSAGFSHSQTFNMKAHCGLD